MGSLSDERQEPDLQVHRRRRWRAVGAVAGFVAIVALLAIPVVVERFAEGRSGARMSDLDEFVTAIEEAQDGILSFVSAGREPLVDRVLATLVELQAVVDGAKAGYVEGGVDPGGERVCEMVEGFRERVERALRLYTRSEYAPRGAWERCGSQADAPRGTRGHVKEALRVCIETIDLSESSALAASKNIDDFLDETTGNYGALRDLAFKWASGASVRSRTSGVEGDAARAGGVLDYLRPTDLAGRHGALSGLQEFAAASGG